MSELRISAACGLLGISPSTLRHWEKRYDYALSVRSPGGHRYFDRELVLGLKDALAEGLRGKVAVIRAIELKYSGRYRAVGRDEVVGRLDEIATQIVGMTEALEQLAAEIRLLQRDREQRQLRRVA